MSVKYDPTPVSETETIDDIINVIQLWIDEINSKWNGGELDLYDTIEKDAYRNALILVKAKKLGLEKRLRMQKLRGKHNAFI